MAFTEAKYVREVLDRHAAYSPIDTYVETGTNRAIGIQRVIPIFKVLHTIELSPKLYEQFTPDLKAKGVHCYLGDSAKTLAKILPKIDQPVVFMLDAHWCYDWLAVNDFPLWRELEVIAPRTQPDIIMVDDVQAFDGKQNEKRKGRHAEWYNTNGQTIRDAIGLDTIHDSGVIWDHFVVWRTDRGSAA